MRSAARVLVIACLMACVGLAALGTPPLTSSIPTPSLTPTQTPTTPGVNGQWYTHTSIWNTPIPKDPAIAANNSSLIDAWANTTPTQCGGLSFHAIRLHASHLGR